MNLKTEKYFWKKGLKIIAGLDEAGRGPLAGPVSAAAVIINSKIYQKIGLNKVKGSKFQIPPEAEMTIKNFKEILKYTRDSKKLSASQREKIFQLIKTVPGIKFSYAFVSEKIIDKINIEKATFLAMRKSLKKLKIKPDLILVDGNRKISQLNILQKTIVRGDDKIFSIALASVIAKVIRDKKMMALAKKYPQYHFEIHKGYPTKLHRKLLKKYGPSPVHRKSYKPVKNLMK
ncbi:MAG: ribonuclease HII [Minisyncoccia bacterium]